MSGDFAFIRRELQAQIPVFELEGRLDGQSHRSLLKISSWIREANVKGVLFDFRKVKEIQGGGFISLLALFSRKEYRRKKVILYGLARPYEELLQTVFRHPSNVELLKTEAEAIQGVV